MAPKARQRLRTGKVSPSIVIDAGDRPNKPIRSLRFGAVTVLNTEPDETVLIANVKAGRDALSRAAQALVKPGVKLKIRPGVPVFRVDAREPGILIREIDGRIERGRLVRGDFITVG